MHREALSLCPHPHPDRFMSLSNLGDAIRSLSTHSRQVASLGCRDDESQWPADLDEAIACTRELLVEHFIEGHKYRDSTLNKLQSLLQVRSKLTGNPRD
jgi:hypothetical protein